MTCLDGRRFRCRLVLVSPPASGQSLSLSLSLISPILTLVITVFPYIDKILKLEYCTVK